MFFFLTIRYYCSLIYCLQTKFRFKVCVEVADIGSGAIFVLNDASVQKLVKFSCDDVLYSRDGVVGSVFLNFFNFIF